MLEIIGNVKEMVELSRNILTEELIKIEDDRKFTEYEKTIESVFCKLCEIQIELEIGTTKFSNSDECEIDKMIGELLNEEDINEKD